MMRPLPIKLLFFLLSLLPVVASALPNDREKPINIEADHAEIDDQSGVTQYKGDAILTQGSLRIKGDIITFYYDKNKQLKKAVAQGHLATYRQVQKPGEKPVRAQALQMEYHAQTQKIYLLGKSHVWQGTNEFTSNKIEYDINKNVVTANSAPVTVGNKKITPSGRIHIIIQPPGSTAKPVVKAAKSTNQKATTTVESKPKEKAPVASASHPTGQTTGQLNVRSGPSTQYMKLGVLSRGSEVLILTRQRQWMQVRGIIDGKIVIGWVNSRYLQITTGDQPD